METSFLIAGLLCARQYLRRQGPAEAELRSRINSLWRDVEWNWHARDGAQRAVLALEPEQRLGHEPRDPRLERVPDHLRAGGVLAALSDRRQDLSPRLDAKAATSGTGAPTTTSSCRSAPTMAGRCSSRTTRSSVSIRAASRTATPTTGSRTSRAHADQPRALRAQSEGLQGLRRRIAGASPRATTTRATARTRRTTISASSRRPRRLSSFPYAPEDSHAGAAPFL